MVERFLIFPVSWDQLHFRNVMATNELLTSSVNELIRYSNKLGNTRTVGFNLNGTLVQYFGMGRLIISAQTFLSA